MGAPAIAAILIRKEKEMVRAFRDSGATSAEKARSLDALNVHGGLIFSRLRRRAVIRETNSSKYYLDELSWEALRHIRKRVVLVVLLFVVLAFAVTFALTRITF